MATLSTLVGNNTNQSPKVSTYSIAFKSRWAGDRNEITYFKYRAMDNSETTIAADHGSASVGTLDVTMQINPRPPLSHHFEGGLTARGGNGSVSITPQTPYWSVSLLMRPLATTYISTTNTLVTFTTAAGGYTVSSTGSPIIYINGVVWSGTQPFPYSRLVTIVFNTQQTGAVKIGNAFGDSDAVGAIQFNDVGFASAADGTKTTAADVAAAAALFYRKPNPANMLADLQAVGPVSDSIVSLPDSWIVVSSS
jgi:hypothetical protein